MENGTNGNGTLDIRAKKVLRTSTTYGEGSQQIDEYFDVIKRKVDLFSDRSGGLFTEINVGAGLFIYSGHGSPYSLGWHD